MREGWVGRMRSGCRRGLLSRRSLAPVRKFTRSLLPRVHHRRPLYFVDLTNRPFMFLTPYRPNKQLITHCDRKPSVLTASCWYVTMGGPDGGGALDTSQLLIARYRIGIRIVVSGWLAASTLTGGRKLVRRHWVMSELGRCPYLLLPDVALVRMG